MLEPVPSELVREAGKRQDKPSTEKDSKLTADAHLMSRLKATYLNMYQDDEKKS